MNKKILLLALLFSLSIISWCTSSNNPSILLQSNKWSIKAQYYQAYKDTLYEKVWIWYSKYFVEKYDTAFIWFSASETSLKIINKFINWMVQLEQSDKKVVARWILILLACKQSEVSCNSILTSNNLTEDEVRKMVGY